MTGVEDVAQLGIDGLEHAVLVGRGAFGSVYRARQPRLNRVVAVKVLTTVLDPAALERFEREGYAMGSVAGHPNIVQILGVGTTDTGRPYLLMPFVAGGSLEDGPPLSWREAVRHAVRLCGALATAHGAGILHRDLKPANVLQSEFGEPLLADFGISRVTSGFQTATGVVHASLSFAPPEILDGAAASVAADVYSLAATVHCLISGSPPFAPRAGEGLVPLYVRIGREQPPDLRVQGVPDLVCRALEAAMAKDPAARPPSAVALGRLLQEAQRDSGLPVTSMALAGVPDVPAAHGTEAEPTRLATPPAPEPETTAPTPPAGERRRKVPLALAALVVLAAAVAGFVFWPGGGGSGAGQGDSEISYPTAIAVTADGSVLISDQDQHRVIQVDQDGDLTVIAGTGEAGNTGDGGLATEAGLENPSAVAVTSEDEVFVASGGVLRRIDDSGMIGPVTGFPPDFAPVALVAGKDNLYVASEDRILVRDRTGKVTVLVEAGRIESIEGMALHPDGSLAVSDPTQNQILRITRDGKATRIAGVGPDAEGPRGDGLPALQSDVPDPTGLAFDGTGRLFFSDAGDNRVRVIEANGTLRTVAGSPEGYSEGDDGDGGPGRQATLRLLGGPLAVDAEGNLYIGDVTNERVRRLSPDGVLHAFV